MLTIRGLVRMRILLGHVMRVAGLELGERGIGGWHWLLSAKCEERPPRPTRLRQSISL